MSQSSGKSLFEGAIVLVKAVECEAPAQLGPASLRAESSSKCATVPVPEKVYKPCKQGHEHTPSASFTIDCTAPNAKAPRGKLQPLQTILHSVKHDLATRGGLPTALTMLVSHRPDSHAALVHCTNVLGPSRRAITSLKIIERKVQRPASEPATPFKLHPEVISALASFPALRALTMQGCGAPLPHPSRLKHLTYLDIDIVADDDTEFAHIASSVTPLLHQITTLQLQGCPSTTFLLLNNTPQKPLPLTHLSTKANLDDNLLALLLRQAPQLAHLTVNDIVIDKDWFKATEWCVTHLTVTQEVCDDWLHAEQLCRLPKTKDGATLMVEARDSTLVVTAETDQGMPKRLLAHLPTWQLDVKTLVLACGLAVPRNARHTALTNALQQLPSLKTPTTTTTHLELHGWDWTVDTLAVLASQVPQLPTHYKLSLALQGELTNELLGAVLACGPAVASLSVASLCLRSEEHAGVAWPWERLTVTGEVNVCQLLRLPDPKKAGSVPTLAVSTMWINFDVMQVGPKRLASWLKHVQCDTDTTFELWCDEERPQCNLPTLLSILAPIKFTTPAAERSATAKLCSTRIDFSTESIRDRVGALQILPKWAGATLDLRFATFMNSPDVCKQVGIYVPQNYREWRVRFMGDWSKVETKPAYVHPAAKVPRPEPVDHEAVLAEARARESAMLSALCAGLSRRKQPVTLYVYGSVLEQGKGRQEAGAGGGAGERLASAASSTSLPTPNVRVVSAKAASHAL